MVTRLFKPRIYNIFKTVEGCVCSKHIHDVCNTHIQHKKKHDNIMTDQKLTKDFKFLDYDCIGFDLDNTLARYKVGAMIKMEYNIIANYLVENKGYSRKYLLQPLDLNFIMKGLIIDNENGNLLRLGPDGLILQATHGTKLLTDDEILKYYPSKHWNPTDLFIQDPLQTWNGTYAEKMRALLDYFDIVLSMIFARTIDSIDNKESTRTTQSVYPDLIEALQNMFTREHFKLDKGEYFPLIKSEPEKYYYKCSDTLLNWLKELKKRGKLLFLITGSHVDFANHTAVNTLGPDWKELFDIVVTFAKKPGFFTMRRDFIGLDHFEETEPVKFEDLKLGSIYTHGNWTDLHEFLKRNGGVDNPRFLYVGDNLIQDVYTPNVHAHCDTVAVCEELEAEGINGHERWHPDEQFLVSTIWGSYFHCKKTNCITNWYHIMKSHSKLCVPSLEYVATYPIDHVFQTEV